MIRHRRFCPQPGNPLPGPRFGGQFGGLLRSRHHRGGPARRRSSSASSKGGRTPDIDVDFEHERREEVIQYIYGKYGREQGSPGGGAHHLPHQGRCAMPAGRSASASRPPSTP